MSVNRRAPGPSLQAALEEAEVKRQRTVKILVQAAVCAPLVAIAARFMLGDFLMLFVSLLAVIVWFTMLIMMSAEYRKAYKAIVMPGLLREVDPQLRYDPTGGLTSSSFEDSLFHPGKVSAHRAEDLITGLVAGRERKICEMRVMQGRGKSQRQVFSGLFSETHLDHGLKGHVVVVPDLAERLLGKLGTKLQGLRRDRGTLVHFNDVEFEEEFVVYAEHEGEARRLLTKRLRRELLNLRKRAGQDIGLTVCENKLYVLVRCPHNHFEPALLTRATDLAPIARFREDLATVMSVFEAIPLAELA